VSRFIEKAKNNFFKREYKKALLHFSLALKDEPYDLDAKIGVLLSDMAMEKEEEAMALFELYEVSRREGLEGVDSIIETLLSDDEIEIITNQDDAISQTYEDGIEYHDFIKLVASREDFQRALEDLMFSTRIIIHKKEDFIEFVNLLLENDYSNLALNYLETALSLFPHETFFHETLKQLER
jgi:tetratricopeptide (TPR) repeat protein